ncbi:SRPBCC family protein [Robertmurraya massiliosenegalensis]|uniref:SRPBCC family protein n=1 Tax=Robertmurraya massiliosenegalensis TaxID=1287657 RepID=UPI0002EC3943|nr:SRPBCC family protein [Robertmurraya massiliosenegalensis]
MADFQSSIIIRKPVEEVFEYLLTLENIPAIMPNVVKLEKITDGPIEKGTKLVETRNVRGRETKAEIDITEFVPKQIYQTKSVAGGITIIYTYFFDAIEEGTQVQFEADVKIRGLFSFFSRRALVKILKQEDGYLLQYLQEELEGKKEENGE